MKKGNKSKTRDMSLDDLYGCAVPKDCDTSLYTDIRHRASLVPLYEDNEGGIVGLYLKDERSDQDEDPLYGIEKDEVLSTIGYEKDVLLMSERIDEDGHSEFYLSGKTKKWVRPNVA